MAEAVQELPEIMRTFSRCLTSHFEEKDVASSAYNAPGINRIRDQMRKDVVVYAKGVFPMSNQIVSYAQEFFEYYETLTLDEWKEHLPDFLEEVTRYQQCCTEIVRMHEDMMASLKRREDEAKVLISGIEGVNKALKEKRAELEKEAANSAAWAFRLMFVPIVNVFATPRLYKRAKKGRARAAVTDQQVGINETASMAMSGLLVPSLSEFIDRLDAFAGFFSVMKEELTSLHSSSGIQRVTLHHIMMKKKAVKVKETIRGFYTMIPIVQNDLLCIKEEPGDLKYFEEWQKKNQKVCKRIFEQKLKAKLKVLIRNCESIEDLEQLAFTY